VIRRLTSCIALLAVLVPVAARADDGVVAGITLNPLFGEHQSFNDKVKTPPIPAPLLDATARRGRAEFSFNGLPASVSVPYQDAKQGHTSTTLSVLDGTARLYLDRAQHFSLGIGETIYNQTTHYSVSIPVTGGGERQYSRIVGAHYEAHYVKPAGIGRIEASFSYAPTLYGTQTTTFDNLRGSTTLFDNEKGKQIDTSVRYVRRRGRLETIYGLRYINFTAIYTANGSLSDRNVGILPTFGLRRRF